MRTVVVLVCSREWWLRALYFIPAIPFDKWLKIPMLQILSRLRYFVLEKWPL